MGNSRRPAKGPSTQTPHITISLLSVLVPASCSVQDKLGWLSTESKKRHLLHLNPSNLSGVAIIPLTSTPRLQSRESRHRAPLQGPSIFSFPPVVVSYPPGNIFKLVLRVGKTLWVTTYSLKSFVLCPMLFLAPLWLGLLEPTELLFPSLLGHSYPKAKCVGLEVGGRAMGNSWDQGEGTVVNILKCYSTTGVWYVCWGFFKKVFYEFLRI